MQRLLEGFRIVDLTTGLAGPYCTRLLSDLGAEVIKVESLEGDDARYLPPDGFGAKPSATFLELNCGKLGVSLDFNAAKSRGALWRLISLSDALVEDWEEGDLARFGLGYQEISRSFPWLVECSITPYGRTGPYAGRPGSGLTGDAAAGILDQTGFAGDSPLPLGYAFGEMNAGIHAVAGIIAALFRQRREGVGQQVDISMVECSLGVQDTAVQEYLFSLGEIVRTRGGACRSSLVPYGVWTAPDGHIAITGWERLWAGLGRQELLADPRFATPSARIEHKDEVRAEIEETLSALGSVREAEARLQGSDVVAFRVRSLPEAVADPQVAARGLLSWVPDPDRGPMQVRDTPFHFSDATSQVRGPAPSLGEHNDVIWGELCGDIVSHSASDA